MVALSVMINALRELGPRQLGLYAIYQLGLRTGYYRWATSSAPRIDPGRVELGWLMLPDRSSFVELLGKNRINQILAEGDEIVDGQVRLFGSKPQPLHLKLESPLDHWTLCSVPEEEDVKMIWEPARFGWAYTLGRAYYVSEDGRYPEAFWRYTEEFLINNPPYLGINWVSAQEASLRLIAFVYALRIFKDSLHSTAARIARLTYAIAEHAARIPPTLIYARAQNNNHLLTEAAGLYTAGLALPDHPEARRWREMGWQWFNRGITEQISANGAYTQHSTNYQRLLLQVALWMNKLANSERKALPISTRERLAAATRWTCALLDTLSGRVPNLGSNDGAYILPVTTGDFRDYRPVLQAAKLAFWDGADVEDEPIDEMALWLVNGNASEAGESSSKVFTPSLRADKDYRVLRLKNHPSWAYLRAVHFNGRPGHADQLHFDLWWRGENVAIDPGTFSYNAPAPWDNALTSTHVHNTIVVNGQEQMQRVGRFLYLKRSQAEITECEVIENGAIQKLVARHDGYCKQGVIHERAVTAHEIGRWIVEDMLLTATKDLKTESNQAYEICLHWLLPDWKWEVIDIGEGEFVISIESPHGRISLSLSTRKIGSLGEAKPQIQLSRAGELVFGTGEVQPFWGWSSPTYGDKIPALSLRWTLCGSLPIHLRSEWNLP